MKWQQTVLKIAGIALIAVWPVRWAVRGLPGNLLTIEGGGAWPLHLLAELMTAALFIGAAGAKSRPQARLLQLTALARQCTAA